MKTKDVTKENRAKTAGSVTTVPARKEKKAARKKKDEETRQRLIKTAGEIIGEHGYAGCSIARLTLTVGIAHGAFYLHFSAQQDLFDQILPTLGADMANTISDAIRGSTNAIEAEQRGFKANFDYLNKHPYMYRVMVEAELYAPEAHARYQQSLVEKYARFLKRTLSPELEKKYAMQELEVIATVLIGARINLLRIFGVKDQIIHPLPKNIMDSYMRFVSKSLETLT